MAVLAYREALNQALREEMLRDERVFLMGEDIGMYEGAYRVTAGLLAEFGPRRVVDTPIAENGFVGAAIGAAMMGLRPIVEIMTINFMVLAMDQFINTAAKMRYMFGGQVKLPLVVRTPGGAGLQLGAQHSQSLEAWFANVPGILVVAPVTPADAKGMLKTAVRQENPVLFVEHLALYTTKGEVPDGDYTVPFGKADVKREGQDVTIVGVSRQVLTALGAADILARDGIEAEVVDLRSLRPLDAATIIASVQKTSRLVVVEEGWRPFGVGAEIAALVQEQAFDYLDAPIQRVASKDVPMPYNRALEQLALPHEADVVAAVRRVVG
ncbi:MAG: pyruvate dehydrogenase complex E1 component subunit beta [Chloroflexi bacterium]|nr:pyruvate dehydrogenase complex E1 component subunit beta [Chloroflexota bacterium]